MKEVNLLKDLPVPKRNLKKRSFLKTKDVIETSKEYGELYFDGPREYGYGGYKYDGRWKPVAKNIINYYELKEGDCVLDIGSAKGFLIHDLINACPGLNIFGLDISEYAINKSYGDSIGSACMGTAEALPFKTNYFDLVISINTIHNLIRQKAINALKEIQRVSRGKSFIQVDSYFTKEQKDLFEEWVPTAQFHDYPGGWLEVFKEAGYMGDYYWTVIQ
ncbi:MAG: class I SAM-dependent methyltransferase [Gammaproteobacteria bacterium]